VAARLRDPPRMGSGSSGGPGGGHGNALGSTCDCATPTTRTDYGHPLRSSTGDSAIESTVIKTPGPPLALMALRTSSAGPHSHTQIRSPPYSCSSVPRPDPCIASGHVRDGRRAQGWSILAAGWERAAFVEESRRSAMVAAIARAFGSRRPLRVQPEQRSGSRWPSNPVPEFAPTI